MTLPDGSKDDRVVRMLREALPDLLAVYRFGSTAEGAAVRDSDLDLAVLCSEPIAPERRWDLQETLAVALRLPVDLLDLRRASTVMRVQVLQSAVLLWEADAYARERFEVSALSSYAYLNEERREILRQITKEGTVYGR
ncbi:MAG: type VII toxin-antitoxin system MntA family adenylyltransferase antitoxin [Acidobacteriota bacterium]